MRDVDRGAQSGPAPTRESELAPKQVKRGRISMPSRQESDLKAPTHPEVGRSRPSGQRTVVLLPD